MKTRITKISVIIFAYDQTIYETKLKDEPHLIV
jgi:hypothetical protein